MNATGKGGFKDHPELINRSGRPRSEIDIIALMDECITEADHRAAFKALKKRYRRGELKVVEYIQDRRFGKPMQRQEHSGADGNPLEVVFRYLVDQTEKEGEE